MLQFDQDGSALYLRELTKYRTKNPGMEYLLEVDSLVRNEVEDSLREDDASNWGDVFKQILKDRRDLWGQAVINVKTHRLSSTPPDRKRGADAEADPPSPEKKSRRAAERLKKKEKDRQMKQQLAVFRQQGSGAAQVHQAPQAPQAPKGAPKGKGKGAAGSGRSIPQAEFDKIKSLPAKNSAGVPFCRWYASSMGCSMGSCKFAHECPQCGQQHSFTANH